MVVKLKLYCSNTNQDFSWFRYFSKFYIDDDIYGLEINPNIQFYRPKTGETLSVKETCRIAIIEPGTSEKRVKALIDKKKVCGFVVVSPVEKASKRTNIPNPFYTNLTFYFKDNLLEPSTRECKFMLYAKKYNTRIKAVVPPFPDFEYLEHVKPEDKPKICLMMSRLLGV